MPVLEEGWALRQKTLPGLQTTRAQGMFQQLEAGWQQEGRNSEASKTREARE